VGFKFRIEQFTIAGDFEGARSARYDFNGFALFYKQVPRTERTRLVVSHFAEFNMDGHDAEYPCVAVRPLDMEVACFKATSLPESLVSMPRMILDRQKLFILTFCAGLGLALPALAQEDNERIRGATLAQELCSGCHVVSENQRGSAYDGVPSFRTLGRSELTNAQLRGWLSEPHPVMPAMPLSEREIAAVIAYIRSFAD